MVDITKGVHKKLKPTSVCTTYRAICCWLNYLGSIRIILLSVVYVTILV